MTAKKKPPDALNAGRLISQKGIECMHSIYLSSDATQAAAWLVALCWARQLRDAGQRVPPIEQLTRRVLREVRR